MAEKILQSGHFQLRYQDGAIRKLKIGDSEIIRMMYFAVRDRNWGTVPARIIHETVEQKAGGFEVQLTVESVQQDIDFSTRISISGQQDQITFAVLGTANSSFLKNRIGICALHPIRECAGKPAKVLHPDNSSETFRFPEYISPEQPVKEIRELEWDPQPEIHARLRFEGDIFEMEDQRNWTDASFKTYCTPLSLPFPSAIEKGETVQQTIVLTAEVKGKSGAKAGKRIQVEWDETRPFRLPEIGLGVSSREEAMLEEEAAVFSCIAVARLRADIHMTDQAWPDELEKAMHESALLQKHLFVCLYLDDDFDYQLQAFISAARAARLQAVMPVNRRHLPHSRFRKIAAALRTAFPGIRVGTGVNAHFAELNRNRPDMADADFIGFAASPQVHAFDDLSLIENHEGLSAAVRSARKLFPHLPVWISPLTLKQRFNVVATAEETVIPGQLPPQVDVRQSSVFAASWTLGAISRLAQAGAAAVDLFETTGWRGIMQGNFQAPLPGLFPATVNETFPLFHLLQMLNGTLEGYPSISSNPSVIEGLIVRKHKSLDLILANYSGEQQRVQLAFRAKAAASHKKQDPDMNNSVLLEPFALSTFRRFR
ncbi:MAG: hypothetical protein AAGU19_10585 [Prolixibacteraceae bacterium]